MSGFRAEQHHGCAGTAEPQPIKPIGSAHKISGFFESIPAGCDLYILSYIIHNWSEAQCLSILANCHRAMSPGSPSADHRSGSAHRLQSSRCKSPSA
ncbi:MAG: hypothetical protein E6H74_01870 [Betaproteobacteria bacterium]|nr:MAG: hypothetical protein E6H74_01870 [Betaproteobacteria bacterium]